MSYTFFKHIISENGFLQHSSSLLMNFVSVPFNIELQSCVVQATSVAALHIPKY
jgi:hypothetical protein